MNQVTNPIKHSPYHILTFSFLLLTTFLAFILSSSFAFATTSVVDEINITLSVACSMAQNLNTAHSAMVLNGQTVSDIGTTTIKTTCNDNTGYAIYAIGYTDNEYGKTVLTNSSISSANDIATSTTISDNVSSWAMKLSATGSSYVPIIVGSTEDEARDQNTTPDYSNYLRVPTEYEKVAYFTSSTDLGTAATGSSLTTTYRVHASPVQPAGTYIGQVKYTLVHPNTAIQPPSPLVATDCSAYAICYAPNNADVEGDMSSIGTLTAYARGGKQTSDDSGNTIDSNTTSVTLIAPNYKRAGYGFAGWSTDYEADSASTIYGPNQTITLGSGSGYDADVSTNGLILYPVWVASNGNMQGWTGCSGMTAATYDSGTGKVSSSLANITALIDTRDNNVYAVAKLADGNCWMIENLRINAEATRGATNKSKSQGYGESTTYGNFIGLADSEDANFTDSVTPTTTDNAINSLYSSDGSTTIDIGTSNSPANRMPRYNNNNTNMASGGTNSNGTTLVTSYSANNNHVRWYSYGNYYTWAAAIASTKHYSTYSGGSGSDAAGTSICPSSWKLPLGYTSNGTLANGANDSANRVGSFSYLDRKMGGTGATQDSSTTPTGAIQSAKWRSFPNNFVYSGNCSGTCAQGRNSSGVYRSSSASSGNYAYNLRMDGTNNNFIPGTSNLSKSLGNSVRCIIGS